MNAVLIRAIIALLGNIIPAIGNNADMIQYAVNTLISLFPLVVQEYKDLVPEVQNIITALKGTDGITDAQWAELDALQAQADSEFDQAAKDEGV